MWADGETNKIAVTFELPTQYVDDLAFHVLADQSAATVTGIDYELYIQTAGTTTAWGTSATDHDAVTLSANAASAQEVTLSVTAATHTASLAAGKWVTLLMWRDDASNASTADLEIYGVSASFTSSQ